MSKKHIKDISRALTKHYDDSTKEYHFLRFHDGYIKLFANASDEIGFLFFLKCYQNMVLRAENFKKH